jgi:hypothetical protein
LAWQENTTGDKHVILADLDGTDSTAIVLQMPSGRDDNIKFEDKVLTRGDEPTDVPGAGGMNPTLQPSSGFGEILRKSGSEIVRRCLK